MPSLGGATEWLDSEPLGPAELRGHVVLVDFWTLTCSNWLRTEPYIAPGRRPTETTGCPHRRPHVRVLVRAPDRPRPAGDQERGINYPSRSTTTTKSGAPSTTTTGRRCTPSTPTGIIRDHHVGEGRYEQSERAIQRLLGVERELACVEGFGVLIGVLGFPP
jgi:hypothetical protein